MRFADATSWLFGPRASDLEPVKARETPGSSMSPRVFAAEAQDILGSRAKRGVTDNEALEAAKKQAEDKAKLQQSASAPPGQPDKTGKAEADDAYWTPPVDANLFGLALSGGGIRSATFCLGTLQVLGERGVLRNVDYLSTVSGGGYIGSFWTCFLARSKVDKEPLAHDSERFQRNPLYMLQHVKGQEEDASFQRLRNYANYLMIGGLWGALRGPAVIIRGLLINFIMVLPYIFLLSAAVALLFGDQIREGTLAWDRALGLPIWGWALGIAFVVAVVLSTVLQSRLRRGGKASAGSRRWLFAINMGLVFLALVIIWIDFQPKVIHALFCIPGVSPMCGPVKGGTWAFLFDGEFWSAVSAALGTISAVVAGLTASRATDLKAKLALAAVAILVPLSFVFLHFLLVAWAVIGLPPSIQAPDWVVQYVLTWWGYLVVAVVLLAISNWSFDVNATSLHNFYRDSLSRTFLFSVQDEDTKREDDLGLGQVEIAESGGPYHLINATVNNPDLEEEALRGRRSDFFVFGSKYSGSNRLGYCPTQTLEDADKAANLGTALAVSAAALAPNMGEKTKPLLTFLLAMLNLRLGYWLPTPTKVTASKSFGAKLVGPIYFFAELLGLGASDTKSNYINLSDGGHIENLGIFELLRRRCKYIVAIDSEADPNMTFNGLATLIRLARTDMGIDVDIDVDDLRKDAEGLSRRHWALGRIDYGGEQYGELLYVKSSLTGSENEYITEYRSRNPDFPHQTTSDQFFDEVQFEAYRALGYRVGSSMVPPEVDQKSKPDDIFAKLRQHDSGSVRRQDAYFDLLDHRRSIDQLLADPALYGYAREIVPELDTLQPVPPDVLAEAEAQGPQAFKLHQVCNEQLQLMERALLALRLDDMRNRNRRSNRGWMNLFRRWGRAKTFQRLWAANIANYSIALQDFCRDELGLDLRAEWQSVPETGSRPAPESGAISRQLVATLSAIHDEGGESPRFPVAEVTIRPYEEGETLTAFRLETPYGGFGLRELLFRELSKHKIWHDSPSFDPRELAGADREATIRALIRCHFHPVAKVGARAS